MEKVLIALEAAFVVAAEITAILGMAIIGLTVVYYLVKNIFNRK